MIRDMRKNKAWFVDRSDAAPMTLYVIYNNEMNEPWWHIHFMQGKELNLEEVGTITYNVENTKWGTRDYIMQWDFLPTSTAVPLANARALKVLEEIAKGQFQAIPTELRLPDGSIIADYKLINVTTLIDSVDPEKSIPESPKYWREWKPYKTYYHKRDCLGEGLHIAIDESLVYLGSEELRKALKVENKFTGLVFRKSYTRHRFVEE